MSAGDSLSDDQFHAHLGPAFHATVAPQDMQHKDWVHFGSRQAAEDRMQYSPPPQYQSSRKPDWHLVEADIIGRVYPKTLSDDHVNALLPARKKGRGDLGMEFEGYHVVPYTNDIEDPGSTSYLVHRKAIHPRRTTKPGT